MGNDEHEEAEVTPGEDLMQEHGALERILLLFPAFRDVLGRSGYRDLGERFEDKEREVFGEHGFQHAVAEIARLETALDIADLARSTAP